MADVVPCRTPVDRRAPHRHADDDDGDGEGRDRFGGEEPAGQRRRCLADLGLATHQRGGHSADPSTGSETLQGLSTDVRQVRDQAEPGGRRIRDRSGRRVGTVPPPAIVRSRSASTRASWSSSACSSRSLAVAAVPLADLVHALERRVRNGDGAELSGYQARRCATRRRSDPRWASERIDARSTMPSMKWNAARSHVATSASGGAGSGSPTRICRIALTGKSARSLFWLIERSSASRIARSKRDLWRLRENHLAVGEIDDDDRHLKSVTFRSQVPPNTAVRSSRR